MSRHRVYPVIPTVQPRRRKALRYASWLGLFLVVALMALGAAGVIVKLSTVDSQVDRAFMQGMRAGHQVCPRGA